MRKKIIETLINIPSDRMDRIAAPLKTMVTPEEMKHKLSDVYFKDVEQLIKRSWGWLPDEEEHLKAMYEFITVVNEYEKMMDKKAFIVTSKPNGHPFSVAAKKIPESVFSYTREAAAHPLHCDYLYDGGSLLPNVFKNLLNPDEILSV